MKNKSFRKRLFEIIEVGREDDKASRVYDTFMMIVIIISIIPLCTHRENHIFAMMDKITVTIFVIDYMLRLFTADYKVKKGAMSFVVYPFTFMALVDLISILPSLTVIKSTFRLLRIIRLLKTFKVFRVLKFFRYSKNVEMIVSVLKKQKDSLIAVVWFAIGYIFVSALVIFNVEPETFPTLFDAIYWATISLTTVGYGDLFATSDIGKVITMISSLCGVAVVALPAGILMTGYSEELMERRRRKEEDIQ